MHYPEIILRMLLKIDKLVFFGDIADVAAIKLRLKNHRNKKFPTKLNIM